MTNNDQAFLVQKIRTQYTEQTHTKLDELKKLDQQARRPANLFAYAFGSVGAIVMGTGMSLIMTDIGETIGIANTMPIGIAIGIVGMLIAIVNYPLYKHILASRRRQYADRIIALSDTLMKG